MWIGIIATLVVFSWFGHVAYIQYRASNRELGRFNDNQSDLISEAADGFNTLVSSMVERKKKKLTLSYQAKQSEERNARKLYEAGLESTAAQGKYLLFKIGSSLIFPLLGASSYFFFIPYYATLTTIVSALFGVLLPVLYLKARTVSRNEHIERELPMLLDLTNLGTSAGWDVSSSLERVIDSLYEEFPDHPLIKEFKKARWLTTSGYTWHEALNRTSQKLGNDSVRRTTLALGQAIKQGGDRTTQLEGISQDAHRIYHATVDKRLAALPVKATIIMMVLMVAYLMVILAPALVSLKVSVFS